MNTHFNYKIISWVCKALCSVLLLFILMSYYYMATDLDGNIIDLIHPIKAFSKWHIVSISLILLGTGLAWIHESLAGGLIICGMIFFHCHSMFSGEFPCLLKEINYLIVAWFPGILFLFYGNNQKVWRKFQHIIGRFFQCGMRPLSPSQSEE
jgi:hypothetical protein